MKLYVGCSLTGAPEAFVREVEKLKDDLRRDGHEVFDFLGLVAGTPKDVFEYDIRHCIADCDRFIALCDLPSTGLGCEIIAALFIYGKPTLALAQKNAIVTRLVVGIQSPIYRYQLWDTSRNRLQQVREFLATEQLVIAA